MAADSSSRTSRLIWGPAAFALLIFAFNLATIISFPLVWQDEVMFTEPAANLARDGVFLSRAWFFSPENQVWAGNSPLYSILLAPWLKLWGVSPVSARSFGLLLGSLGIVAWTTAAQRAGLVKRGATSLAYLAVLFLAYGVAINLRSGRYDGLGILIFGLLALALTWPPSWKRTLALLSLGMLIPASGMHLIVPIVVAALTAFVVYGRKTIPSSILVGAGIAIGLAILLFAFWKAGAMDQFLHSTRKLSKVGGGSFPKDPSLSFVAVAALVNLAAQFFGKKRDRRLAILCIYPALVTLAFPLVARFPTYYSWIIVFPLAALALYRLGEGERRWSRAAVLAVSFLLVCAVAAGLPLQLAASALFPSRGYDQIADAVARHVRRTDVALVSPPAWYPTWRIAAKTYTTEYDLERKFMSPEDERRVSLLVIDPNLLPYLKERFGPGWHQVGTVADPAKTAPPLSGQFGQKLFSRYDLAIYRRD